MLVPRLKGVPRYHVNRKASKFLKVLDQGNVIKKKGTELEVDQKIEISVWAGLSSGN